jgi:MFS family permease
VNVGVLKERNLLLLLSAGFVSLLGDWALLLALPFYVYQRTGSALSTGGLVAAQLVPRLVLSSPAGVLADRWDRRVTMIGADVFRAVLLLGILVPAAGGPIWLVYLVAVLQASAGQLFTAAEGAVLPNLLSSREDVLAANSVLTTGTAIVRLVGPPLGGVLYATMGLSTSVLVDSASFALSALAIAAVRVYVTAGDHLVSRPRAGFLRELGEGARCVFTNRALETLCLTLGIVMVAQGMLQTLLVPFVQTTLHLDASRYGLLMAAQGTGSLLGAAGLGPIGRRLTGGRIAMGGALLVAGGALLGFAVARVFLLNAAFILLLSGPVVIATVWLRTYYQQHVENRMLGRVLGLIENVSALGVLCGTAVASGLAGRFGPTALMVAAGAVLLAAGLTAFAGLGGASTLAARPAPTPVREAPTGG